MNKKINLGQFNTKNNVWLKPQVIDFITNCGYSNVLDPFAGEGDLLKVAEQLGFEKTYGLDIDKTLGWDFNNSLVSVPYYENTLIITNPPYLSRVSASTKKSKSTAKYFDSDKLCSDLYQIAIKNIVDVYHKSVFIIPETYCISDFYKGDLTSITILEENPFEDTDCPVCVACFTQREIFSELNTHYDIYKNDRFVFDNGTLRDIARSYIKKYKLKVEFNIKDGNVGLRCVDGVDPDDRIRFCLPEELNYDLDTIKVSSRAITVLRVSRFDKKSLDINELIKKANENLSAFRADTYDVVLAPFKNNNKEGRRRRRLDFRWARNILNYSIN